MSHTPITAAGVPAAPSSFSHGIAANGLIQVSGQGPLDADGTVLADLDIEAQTTATLDHINRVLQAGGTSFENVIMLRVYLTDRANFAGMNRAFEKYVEAHRNGFGPARTTIIAGLPFEGMLVEIDALATAPSLS